MVEFPADDEHIWKTDALLPCSRPRVHPSPRLPRSVRLPPFGTSIADALGLAAERPHVTHQRSPGRTASVVQYSCERFNKQSLCSFFSFFSFCMKILGSDTCFQQRHTSEYKGVRETEER